jgi:hypothetical protein
LIIGGGLTSQILAGGQGSLFITQSNTPDASTLAAAPWQTEQLVLFVGFILFNLIGMGVTVMIVMWLLHWGLKRSEAETAASADKGS